MNKIEENEKPRPLPDFRVESERLRLGPSGFRIFFNIAVNWELTDEETLGLLALDSETPIEQLRIDPAPQLFTEERLFRISYLIRIYKELHICHGDDLADQWIKLRNQNGLFGGIAPLEFMIRGGLDAVQQVRRLIDARCAGMWQESAGLAAAASDNLEAGTRKRCNSQTDAPSVAGVAFRRGEFVIRRIDYTPPHRFSISLRTFCMAGRLPTTMYSNGDLPPKRMFELGS